MKQRCLSHNWEIKQCEIVSVDAARRPIIMVQYPYGSMTEYRLKWRRESNAPRPEDQYDGDLRQDAVEQLLAEFDGVNLDDVEYVQPPRHLSGDPGPLIHVCELVVENAVDYYLLYKFLTNDEQNQIEPSDPDVLKEVENDERSDQRD